MQTLRPYQPTDPPIRRLVLVGGGHTHVQVLRNFAMEGLPERTEVTVVLDVPVAVYSGMVPGVLAGDYTTADVEIDVLPLARRAGARVVLAACQGVDPLTRRIALDGRPSLPYDVASFDIGSTVAHLDLPGARREAIPTRPISRLVERFEQLTSEAQDAQQAPRSEPRKLIVVGGGAGGVEVAFCAQERFRQIDGVRPEVTVVYGSDRPLVGSLDRLAKRVLERGRERGFNWLRRTRAAGVESDALLLDDGTRLPADHVFWVTGAAPHPVLGDPLPTDRRGFVRTRPTLQVEGHDDLFAVGDCATITATPHPKAGVYAVRQGPVLIDNLRRWLDDRPLRAYRPQTDFLALLNLGDGTAIGARSGLVFEGRWVFRLKDRIDRKFMDRFQVLDPAGRLRPGHEMDEPDEPMACGGCAAKVEQNALTSALQQLNAALGPIADGREQRGNRQLSGPDDIATYDLEVAPPDRNLTLALNVDGFRSFTDDPWLIGRAAAQNALSDLQVKGADPRCAQALVTVPIDRSPDHARETLFQVLHGARTVFDELGVELVGGHSMTGPELAVAFAIDGLLKRPAILKSARLEVGDRIVLTRPLGSGVLLHADMMGRARGPWIETLFSQITSGNGAAAQAAMDLLGNDLRAATDVTGFGLAGHLLEVLGSPEADDDLSPKLATRLTLSHLPLLPGTQELLTQGFRSSAHVLNYGRVLQIQAEHAIYEHQLFDLLFDPQTCGGLLLVVPASRSDELLTELHREAAPWAAVVGEVTDSDPGNRSMRPIHVVA